MDQSPATITLAALEEKHESNLDKNLGTDNLETHNGRRRLRFWG
jgi:hypothetical protein